MMVFGLGIISVTRVHLYLVWMRTAEGIYHQVMIVFVLLPHQGLQGPTGTEGPPGRKGDQVSVTTALFLRHSYHKQL